MADQGEKYMMYGAAIIAAAFLWMQMQNKNKAAATATTPPQSTPAPTASGPTTEGFYSAAVRTFPTRYPVSRNNPPRMQGR